MSKLAEFLGAENGIDFATDSDFLDSHEVLAHVTTFLEVKTRLAALGIDSLDRDALIANSSGEEQDHIFALFKHDMLVKAIRSVGLDGLMAAGEVTTMH